MADYVSTLVHRLERRATDLGYSDAALARAKHQGETIAREAVAEGRPMPTGALLDRFADELLDQAVMMAKHGIVQ